MKQHTWVLALLLPVPLLFMGSAVFAQVAVLGLTLGIFFGTLSMRKPGPGDASTSHH